MSMKGMYGLLYRRAAGAADLPWHLPQVPAALERAVRRHRDDTPRRALDLGCGAGGYSVYLAQQGFAVTALDFMPRALALTSAAASAAGVTVTTVQADVMEWQPLTTYHLILDYGCLHGFGQLPAAYKAMLLRALAPGGTFVLGHFNPRHRFDWRPVGPRRRTRAEIERFFAPELAMLSYGTRDERSALPVGPRVQIGEFEFQVPRP